MWDICFLRVPVYCTVEAVRTAEIKTVTMRNDRDVAYDKAEFAIKCRDTVSEERNTEMDAAIRADDRRTELIGACWHHMCMCMTKAALHAILQLEIYPCELHLNCFAHFQASISVSTSRFRIPRSGWQPCKVFMSDTFYIFIAPYLLFNE